MMTEIVSPPPKLLKSRIRHTRWFALLLIPIVIFSMGLINHEAPLHEIMEWSGFFLVALCVLGRSYCSAFIGGIKNETVVREGPFSVVRNPLYVFSFLGILGIGMQSGMFSLLAILVLVFVIYYPRVVAREEAFLLNTFGEPYRRYMAEVPRWWPKFSLWHEPGEISVRPFFLRHTMMDAILFFLPFPVFEMLETLHESGVLPAYLVLP